MARIDYKNLCGAIAQNDLKRVKSEILANPAAALHWKPLMDSAIRGNVASLKLLLDEGIDPNTTASTASRHSALSRITQHHKTIPRHEGHVACLELLLERGTDPDLAAGPLALPPIVYATMGPELRFIEVLRRVSASDDVFVASALHDVPKIESIATGSLKAKTDSEGRTPLHYVALSGMWRKVGSQAALRSAELLLTAGIDVDCVQEIKDGDEIFPATPFWYSVAHAAHFELAEFLLKRGADPQPAVFAATFMGDLKFVELLDSHGVNWNQKFLGATPLMDLLVYRRTKLVPWLVEHGANVKLRDNKGRTPLHIAAENGVRNDCLELLLHAGADKNATNDAGHTPLELAERKNRRNAVAFLKS